MLVVSLLLSLCLASLNDACDADDDDDDDEDDVVDNVSACVLVKGGVGVISRMTSGGVSLLGGFTLTSSLYSSIAAVCVCVCVTSSCSVVTLLSLSLVMCVTTVLVSSLIVLSVLLLTEKWSVIFILTLVCVLSLSSLSPSLLLL